MCRVIDSKVKFVEDNSLSLSLTCTNKLSITLHGQRFSKLLNITQDIAVIAIVSGWWFEYTDATWCNFITSRTVTFKMRRRGLLTCWWLCS
jgi:hypothetical protein